MKQLPARKIVGQPVIDNGTEPVSSTRRGNRKKTKRRILQSEGSIDLGLEVGLNVDRGRLDRGRRLQLQDPQRLRRRAIPALNVRRLLQVQRVNEVVRCQLGPGAHERLERGQSSGVRQFHKAAVSGARAGLNAIAGRRKAECAGSPPVGVVDWTHSQIGDRLEFLLEAPGRRVRLVGLLHEDGILAFARRISRPEVELVDRFIGSDAVNDGCARGSRLRRGRIKRKQARNPIMVADDEGRFTFTR